MANTENSDADICNLGLIQVGGDPIDSLDDSDKSDNAQLCKRLYPIIRNICLVEAPWKEVTLFKALGAALSASTKPESAEYEFVFNLPANVLSVVAQIDESNRKKKYPHEVKGGQLYTNTKSNDDQTTAYIEYIKKETDTSKYSPEFIELLALKLAIALAPKLLGLGEEASLQIESLKRDLRLRVLPRAIGINNAKGDIEGGNDEGEDTWIKGRSRVTS